MTLTDATIVTVNSTDDDPTHVVCCADPDVALCGEDVSEEPWITDDDPVTCWPCWWLEHEDRPCRMFSAGMRESCEYTT